MDKNEPTDALENTTSCIAKLFYMKESDEWEEAYVGNCTVVKKVGFCEAFRRSVLTSCCRRLGSGVF